MVQKDQAPFHNILEKLDSIPYWTYPDFDIVVPSLYHISCKNLPVILLDFRV